MKSFFPLALAVVALIALASASSEQNDAPTRPPFRYPVARENCQKGTLYHDGCSWCECMGSDKDECDDTPCGENTLGDDVYLPDSEEEKRSVRSVKRKRSNLCQTVTDFHENDMECFCRDQTWYWCRPMGSAQQYEASKLRQGRRTL